MIRHKKSRKQERQPNSIDTTDSFVEKKADQNHLVFLLLTRQRIITEFTVYTGNLFCPGIDSS